MFGCCCLSCLSVSTDDRLTQEVFICLVAVVCQCLSVSTDDRLTHRGVHMFGCCCLSCLSVSTDDRLTQ